jgi:hypothetical protein
MIQDSSRIPFRIHQTVTVAHYNASMNVVSFQIIMEPPSTVLLPVSDIEADRQYLERLFAQPEIHTDAIAYFKALTAKDSPALDKMMGNLLGKVSRADFSSFCHGFAKGVEYVRDEYHTQPSAIIITDEDAISPCANLDTYVFSSFILWHMLS